MSQAVPGPAAAALSARVLAVRFLALLLALVAGFTAGCRSARPAPTAAGRAGRTLIESGQASWYGPGFYGRKTANGEIFDGRAATAAHRTLPFHSLVEVVNLDTGRSVVVRINDRGPFIKNRIIDLSRKAAEELGVLGPGVARVELYLLATLPATPDEAFAVQTGAFLEKERAQKLAAELRPRFPEIDVHSDGTWHRVQISGLATREAAEAIREVLQVLGYAAVVVPLPPLITPPP